MLVIEDLDEDESNRKSGGELAEEQEDVRFEYWLCLGRLGRRSFLGELLATWNCCGADEDCLGLIANEGQSLSFRMEKTRSRGLCASIVGRSNEATSRDPCGL